MRTCGKCGAKLTGAGPAGLCPRCFLQEGLARAEADSPPAPGANQPLASGVQHPKVHYFGDYELLQEIACGGMGIVYKARQVSLHRIVAVKMIVAGQLANEVFVKRLHIEAEAAAGLAHPNIVSIFQAESTLELLRKVEKKEPERPSGLNPQVDRENRPVVEVGRMRIDEIPEMPMAVSLDGQKFVAAEQGATFARVFDLQTGRVIADSTPHGRASLELRSVRTGSGE